MPPPTTLSVPEIVGGENVKAEPELVIELEIVRPLNVDAVEVANVIAPV